MDMDMEVPDAEELLQLLEANDSSFPDDFEENDYYPEEEEQQQHKQPDSIPKQQNPNQDPKSPLSKHPQNNKRDRSQVLESIPYVGPTEKVTKRSKVNENVVADDDEDWLRYSPPPRVEEEDVVIVEEVKEKILSRFATEIEGDCVPITGFDGDRVYAKIHRYGDEKKKLNVKTDSKGLISDSIRVLMKKVEDDNITKSLQASVEEQSDIVSIEAPVTNEQLWVDKYAPSSFTELLSDEQTNREVLMWLKQWDPCVFGSDITSTTDDVLSALRRHSSGSNLQHSKFSNKTSFRTNNKHIQGKDNTPRENNDLSQEDFTSKGEQWGKKRRQSGPPEQKILLLCGPPGLGKTTLAHVAAKHCGYRVVEINASDDRASSTIEAKILDVVQMNSVTVDSKPKCLVIDEIDGALNDGKGAVEVILKMVSADKNLDTGKENVKSSKKKQGHASLLRPVICICNDLYAPALRPLRQVAKVHVFVQPTVTRVVNRLKYICNREGVKTTNSTALTALAQYTECDIRSCLNTLQFLNKQKEALNVMSIDSQVVGRKDASRSAFDIWKEIFQKRRTKQTRRSSYNPNNNFSDLENLHNLISMRGDYDLILDGVHENFLNLRYYDPLMHKTVKCLDGLGNSDITHQYIMRTQQMSLLAYQPSVAITIHSLVSQVEKPNIEWPKSFHRYRNTVTEKKDSFSLWHNKISPNISRHLSTKSFVEDSVSPLLHILSPPTLRPVALHLLSEKEKLYISQLVDTMVSYAITYKNTKTDQFDTTDIKSLSFDPPIGEFVNFKEYISSHFVLASAVKQVLVYEVEKQKILQSSTNRSVQENQAVAVNHRNKNLKTTLSQKQVGPTISTSKSIGGDSINLKVKSIEKIKKPSRSSASFFDRFRKVSSQGIHDTSATINKQKTVERDSRPLLFKFNEGYTNAVRRPVRMREFLL